jgi:hypothetical protein
MEKGKCEKMCFNTLFSSFSLVFFYCLRKNYEKYIEFSFSFNKKLLFVFGVVLCVIVNNTFIAFAYNAGNFIEEKNTKKSIFPTEKFLFMIHVKATQSKKKLKNRHNWWGKKTFNIDF